MKYAKEIITAVTVVLCFASVLGGIRSYNDAVTQVSADKLEETKIITAYYMDNSLKTRYRAIADSVLVKRLKGE